MTLIDEIKKDQLNARKSKNKSKTSLLTTLIGECENKTDLSDQEVIKIITKFKKNALQIIELGNTHQVIHSQNEVSILDTYIPKQLTEEELENMIQYIINHEPGISMGDVMKQLLKKHKGLFDGRLASTIVKRSLS